MANVKITDLTAYANPAATDVLPIVDVGADVTKKVSIQDLLKNAGSGTAAAPGIAFDGDIDTGIYSPGANQLALSTNGTGRLFVDASGNVGIGTTSPSNLLHVGSIVGDGIAIGETVAGTLTRETEGLRLTATSTTRNISFVTSGTEAMRVDTSGRLLVGTSTSTANVELSENIVSVIKGSEAVWNASFVGYDGSASFATRGPGLVFKRSRGTTDGDFTSVASGDLLARLDFYGADGTSFVPSAQITAQVDGTPGTNDMPGRLVFSTTADGASSATERMRIDSSGNVGIGTTSASYQLELSTDSAGKPSTNTWTIVSDERIKEEIELADLDLCYEAVKNIPLKRFKWKDEVYTEEQAYDRRKLGWIAQDVEVVFPKAVRQHEFKYNQVFEEVVIPAVPAELDDDGNIITEEQPERIEKGELISEEVIEDCRDLNSDQLYAAMYGAIQKLISKVELLEAEVQALKAA